MTDRYKRLAPLSGVLAVGLLIAGLTAASTPDSTASGARVIEYYRHHHTAVYVSATLVAYGGLAITLYFASVADFLRRRGAHLLATTTVVGGAICGTGLLLASGGAIAVNDGPQRFSADEARALNVIQSNLFILVFLGGLAIATLSMGVAMLRTRALPTALGVITTIVGIVAISPAGWFAFLASGLLTLVIAGYVYEREGRPDSVSIPDVPGPRAAADTSARSTTNAS